MLISAAFSFEADSLAAGKEIVATWVVTPGVTLHTLTATEVPRTMAAVVPASGSVGTALAAAEYAARTLADLATGTITPPNVPPAVPFVQKPPKTS